MLHQSVTSTTLFCPLGGVSLKFPKQTRGRWESAKPECRVNATFRQLSHEMAIITKIWAKRHQEDGRESSLWQIDGAHCLHRFIAMLSRVLKKNWPPVGHRVGHKVGHKVGHGLHHGLGHGLPHVLSTPPFLYHWQNNFLQIVRQSGCVSLIDSHASLQCSLSCKLEHRCIGCWVDIFTYTVVVKCESLLGGHGKARCTVIDHWLRSLFYLL